MADIKTYLDKIQSAIYGEEVRGSILNAIAAMNNESSYAKSEATTAEEKARASAEAAKISEEKATQAQISASKIDKMTISVIKLASGESPTVLVSDDGSKKHLTFGIPRGDPGPMPKLSIGTVITGSPGTKASATLTGTAANPILNLTIPEGQRGSVEGVPLANIAASSLKDVTSAGTSNEVAIADHGVEDSLDTELLFETAGNYEYRLCLLELGVSENDLQAV